MPLNKLTPIILILLTGLLGCHGKHVNDQPAGHDSDARSIASETSDVTMLNGTEYRVIPLKDYNPAWCCPTELNSTHRAIMDKMGGYFPVFKDYARNQGYRSDCAQTVVALHEVLHVLSAQTNGFIYNEHHFPNRYHPFMEKVRFANIAMHAELTQHPLRGHPVFRQYILPNPSGTLNMILDEIAIYHQTKDYLAGDAAHAKYQSNLHGHQMAFAIGFEMLTKDERARILKEYAGLFELLN